MGKTKRWFRALLGSKKQSALPPPPADSRRNKAEDKNKKSSPVIISDANDRSGVGYSGGASRDDASSSSPYIEAADANKHAIAVAAATAAVAEAALAAAKAAAEVVRMTSGGSRASTPYGISGTGRHREFAAVKIQSAFRAYLARRALRALKGLVKLQALVRGHIVRKQSSNMLRRMQAMARIQARACAKRAYLSDYPRHSTKSDVKLSWFDWWMEKNSSNDEAIVKNRRADDEKSDKILEIDTGKPHPSPKRGNVAYHNPQNNFSVWNHNEPMFMPFESLSRHSTKSQKPNTPFRSFNFPQELVDQAASSPQVHSVSSSRPGSSNRRGPDNSPQVSSSRPGSSNRRGGPFTSARSDCARSLFSEYMSHPNYMAETESSRAKFRSQSAPRQRMELERPGSTKMFVRGFWDVDKQSDNNSTLHAYFRSQGHSAYSSGDYGPRF